VTLAALRIGNDVSYVTRITDDSHFAWQAQYLVKLEGDSCCSAHWKRRFRVTLAALRIGNDVSYVTRITDDSYFGWQAQYLVKLEGDSCCSAHCK